MHNKFQNKKTGELMETYRLMIHLEKHKNVLY